jgi:filamentous hemagglutinin
MFEKRTKKMFLRLIPDFKEVLFMASSSQPKSYTFYTKSTWRRKLVAWSMLFLYLTQPILASAEVVADPKAPGTNTPQVQTTANGLPVVQITAPSPAGVSRNLYQQFSVDPSGLILNNSQIITQTQLAGYITGNPNLANGSAHIILNEVTSNNPSYLRGYTEVAGQKAEVIIANPNGIYGDGFGFINTSRAVLTTGTPVFGGSGSLDAFRVTGGQISIQGAGMNASDTDRVDIISRAVQVNAGIWSKELNAVTGANQVSYSDLSTKKITGDGSAPTVAIDVGVLGGMYANKIMLVGTENGVGVNSQGTLSASNDNLTLTNDGKITLAGTVSANGSVNVTASDDINTSGTIYAQNNININSTGMLTNSGQAAAGKNMVITARSVSSNGTLGSGINTDGSIGTSGDLNITATGAVNTNGKTIASGNLSINAATIDISGGQTYSGRATDITATGGDINNVGGTLTAEGALTASATGAIKNGKNTNGIAGQITADKVTITANDILNTSGNILQTGTDTTTLTATNSIDNTNGNIATNGSSLSLETNSVENSLGQIQQSGTGTLTINTQGDINNTNGLILTNGQTKITANNIINQGGGIAAQNQAIIESRNNLNNSNGGSLSADTLAITAVGDLSNTNGQIEAVGGIALSAQNINNKSGVIKNTKNNTLNISASQTLDNTQGSILSNDKLTISAKNVNNPANSMAANGDFSLTVTGDFTNQGTLTSGGTLSIAAPNITNVSSGTISAGATQLTADNSIINTGRIEGDQVSANSQNITNNGTIIGGTVTINANNLTNQGATAEIAATDTINLWVANTLVNTDGADITSLGDLNIAANSQTNANGMLVNRTQQVTNVASTIDVGNNLNLATEYMTNRADSVETATTTTTSTQLLTEKPALSSWIEDNATLSDNVRPHGVIMPFYTTAWKLCVTVPKADIISYDPTQKSLIFNDSDITTYNVVARVTGWGYSAPSSINGPINYDGKIAGQTTAYCTKVTVNANGDYYIEYYPGYDPALYINPETIRSVSTDRSSDAQEIKRSTTSTITQEYISNQPNIGKINVGKDLSLNIGQEFLNQYSSVAVGATVSGSVGTLKNQGFQASRTTESTISSTYYAPYGAGGTWGNTTDGPYKTVEYIDGGLAATFTAKTINVTGANISNIQIMPDGTTPPPIGSTVTLPTSTNTSITANNKQTVNSMTVGKTIMTLPKSGLYTVHPDSTSKYLIETDPRFANYSNFISSDYMMEQLNLDPSKVQKRLGDGFYEQKLINEQINQLTGRQYLSGYDNTDSEFKALMDNGVAAATAFNLVPGIALTSAQIANLTKDLVWLVEQQVTLPDGTTQKVLVPQVYLCQASTMKLESSGALIAADTIDIRLSGNSENSGTIIGDSSTYIEGKDIINSNGGQITTSNGLTSLNASNDIINQSSVINGKQVSVSAGRDVINETTTTEISASSKDTNGRYSWSGTNTVIGQKASIEASGDLTVTAGRDISVKGGDIAATGNTIIDAGRNLEVGTVIAKSRSTDVGTDSRYERSTTTNVTSSIQGENNITLTSKGDTTLTGAQVSAKNDLSIGTLGNLTVNAVTDGSSNDQEAGDKKQYHARSNYDETTIGSNLEAGNSITITAGQLSNQQQTINNDVISGRSSDGQVSNQQQTANTNENSGNIKIVGSNISSEKGKVTINADKDVSVEETTERHESSKADRVSSGSILSSTTTETRDSSVVNQVKGSTISGDQVAISSGNDLTVKGSNVVGTNDVTLTATDNVNITSAKETGKDEHYSYTKTSGLFSGGGLGFTIGSQSTKTTTNEQTLDQVGSTVGSINGNVSITAGNKVDSAGTTFVTDKDLNITAKDVTIDNTVNTVDSQTKYEFKQSGLSVSLGGGIVDTATSAYNNIERSGQVEDDRLKALYDYKAYKDLDKINDQLDKGTSKDNLKKDVSVSVSIGSTKTTTEQTTHTETVNTSNINAGGNVNITATAGDVNLIGTNINATDVTLDAKNNINIESAENKMQTDSNTSSSSWSVGGTIGAGYFANASKGSSSENENAITNTGSVINASGTLTLNSGKDTNIIGSQISGDKVIATIDGNLNIASKQDTDDYTAKNQSSGFGVSTGPKGGVTGSVSQGKTDSTYASVTEQAGIYAGEGGFDIKVGKNTDLKGAVISSDATPDKNKISTGTLTYSDIQNHADYNSSSFGVNIDIRPDSKYNEHGITPNIGMPASGDADSTTKSAISPGTIIVGGKVVEPKDLSRDTTNSLNVLGKIFDKVKVEEQKELAGLFGELANEQLHKISEQNGWAEGSPQKIALHALVGAIMADLGGGNAFAGGFGSGLNEALQKELDKIGPEHPDLRQWASFIIGSAAGDTSGAVTAYYGTKYNNEDTMMDFATFIAFYAAGITVVTENQMKVLKNKSGEVLATWNSTVGGWVDSTGNWIGNTYNSIVVWASFEKAVESGEPCTNHRVDDSGDDLPATGQPPNSSADKLNPDGSVKQRRYYGPDGRAKEDIDYNHSDGDGSHTFPHRHTWDWTQSKPRQ